MNNQTVKLWITVSVFFLVLIAAASVFTEQEDQKPEQPASAKITQIVFVKTTKACPCTMRRIETGERLLKQTLTKLNYEIPIKIVNNQTDVVETEKLRKLANFFSLPAIFFLDAKGELIKKLEGNISEKNLLEVLGNNKTDTQQEKSEEHKDS